MSATGKSLEARLAVRLSRQFDTHRKRQRANYQLAKDLGFSAKEAVILQNWTEADIRALATERQGKES